MRRLSGQAARHAGVVLHRLARLAIAVAVLGGAAFGALSWRLSQGPLDLPWLTKRIEAALNQDQTTGQVEIGSAALAWEGFRLGLDRPLDIRLNGVAFVDAAGRQVLTVPLAEVSLSLHSLLLGRVTVRALEIDRPHLNLLRAADGTFMPEPPQPQPDASQPGASPSATPQSGTQPPATSGLGADVDAAVAADARPLLALLTELAKPPATDRSTTHVGPFSQLQRLRIHDAVLVVVDRQFGTTWRAPHAEIDLTRRAEGGVDGAANLTLALGDQQTRLTAIATLPPNKGPIRLRLRLSPVTPAAIARAVPGATALSALDAPIRGEADLQLDDAMRLIALHLALRAGVGQVHLADGVLPITGATLVADATPDHLDLRNLRLTVPSHPGGTDSTVLASGRVDRAADHLTAALGVTVDRVDFADLPKLWPMGVGHGARAWVTENITAGSAHDGHVEVGLEAAPDLSEVTLTRATGTLAGDGLVVHWLRPVPPIVDGSAVLNILDPDTLEIVARSGTQLPSSGASGGSAAPTSGLTLRGGTVRITGIMQHDQFGVIDAKIAGSLPDALALLREKRLQLLDKHPLTLNDPAGQVAATLTLTLPFEQRLTMDQVGIRAHAHLDGVHLGAVAAGRDLDQGVLDLDANVDGLTMSGTAAVAGIPATLKANMDFRAGGPSQVLQRVSVTGRPTARQLTAAGLDTGGMLDGPLGLDATLTERRDGGGEVAVTADLTPTTVALEALAWRKPGGSPMTASGRLTLSHDRLTGIADIQVNGDGAAALGSATCEDGRISTIRIDHLMLGHTDARATILLPAGPGRDEASQRAPASGRANDGRATVPIAVALSGPTLDLAARLTRKAVPHPPRKPQEPSGPHWTLDAHFDRVIMAGGHEITGMVAHVDSDGGLTRQFALDGQTGPQAPFSVRVASVQGKRTLTATATNAGDLLAGLDVVRRMQSGRLSVNGTYDDATPEHTLVGTAEITDFRIRDAPILARLLQGMTLYGLVEVMRGPGLGFSQMTAPFRLTDDALTLDNARAFSSSLGLTIKGTIDLDQQRATLDGTIVPAYFFNSLLGNIPLVGRLFSPERGGGVFAASYSVRGPIDDPTVAVNPLSALTPGFLRGVFGLF